MLKFNSIIYILAFIFQFWSPGISSIRHTDNISEPNHAQVTKTIWLGNIFGDTIQFNELCDVSEIRTLSFQTVSSSKDNNRYFNFERIYSDAGNQISVKFHFYDEEKRLFQRVWEKYLINYSLVPSENMLIQITVNYNGEEYVNARPVTKTPFRYEIYSDVEMNHIDYSVISLDSCSNNYKSVINIEANFSGLVYNETGNRSIQLDGVRLKFQVLLADTSTAQMPEGIVIKPTPQKIDLNEDLALMCSQIEGSVLSEMNGLPCIKWKGKPFICQNKYTMAFRLPEDSYQEALALEGNKLFNPAGNDKPLQNWVEIHFAYRKQWPKFAEAAAKYVKE